MTWRPIYLCAIFCLACWARLAGPAVAQSAGGASGTPAVGPLEITRDTVLDPAKTYGPIILKASGITLDGRGARVIGATQGDPKDYKGVGILLKGVSGVKVKDVKALGWEIGLKIEESSRCSIEHCDFSDNFHWPKHGWGEEGFRGGIVLEQADHCVLRNNKAERVWNACSLVRADANLLEGNDFSHASNTGLSLWTACRNEVRKNNLSWGIRIDPGEVHARDSAGLLVECGSNDNHFLENDITHGGDGVFIRALNGWVSSGNVLEKNDASYANNNCFEAQSPGNTYRGNKANHGSHGMWLGWSNNTIVEDNEACDNGNPKGLHNAPWEFSFAPRAPKSGHAGIIFAGTSNNAILRRNKCNNNYGAGLCFFGDGSKERKFTAYHMIIEQNEARGNRWGIYMEYADWIDLAGNVLEDNQEGNIVEGGTIANIIQHPDNPGIVQHPKAALEGPSSGEIGRQTVLDASASSDPAGCPLSFRWGFGDGTTATGPRVVHAYEQAGFYHAGVTVNNGRFSDLAYRDFRAIEVYPELGTEGEAADWAWDELFDREQLHWPVKNAAAIQDAPPVKVRPDAQSKVRITDDPREFLMGKSSVALDIRPTGNPLRLLYPKSKNASIPLAGKNYLVFWSKMLNPNIHAWKGLMPTITLYESETKHAMLRPGDCPDNWYPPNSSSRIDWTYRAIPLQANKTLRVEGQLPETLNWMTIEFYPWGSGPVRLWIDGMTLK
jgi:parallel beta-helix repeat protein